MALALFGLGGGLLLELLAILRINNGHFTYTLDDPYIHLALAERIRTGFYGINPGEPSAPSSSILWPFLLVPSAGTRFAEYVPFVIGVLCSALTVASFHSLLSHWFDWKALGMGAVSRAILCSLLALATNLIGLPFTGMEHSLQVLIVVLIASGLTKEARTKRVPPWLVPLIALGPLVRYESAAVSLPVSLYLMLRGHPVASVISAGATLLPIGVFSAFLESHGLGLLPASVQLKAQILSSGGLVGGIAANLRTTLRDPTGVLLMLAGVWMLCLVLFSRRGAAERYMAACVGLSIGLHAAAGGYGAYHRWEMYIVTLVLLSLIFLERESIQAGMLKRPSWAVLGVGCLWCGVLASRYVFGLTTVPTAANNIHEQQYQMHRFATEVESGPVAVNDIGYVAFQNRHYVLDLLGLASPELLAKPGARPWVELADSVARAHHVQTAMLYEEWFPRLPATWHKVGELQLSRPRITPAWGSVAFYATSDAASIPLRNRLERFRRSLPHGVRLLFVGSSTPARHPVRARGSN